MNLILLIFYIISILNIAIVILFSLSIYIFADSPTFIRQQIEDEFLDLPGSKIVTYGDIRIANYISDGKILNASIWLHSSPPIGDNISPNSKKGIISLKYGILIDSDSNPATGWDGIDNEISYTWKKKYNKTGVLIDSWERTFKEYVAPGLSRILSDPMKDTNIFQQNERHVLISVDLSLLGLPKQYKIMSYAEVIKDTRTIDFTNWIDIPSTEFMITTFPNPLEIRQNEHKNIGLVLKTTKGFLEDEVNFIPSNEKSEIELKQISDDSNKSLSIEPTVFSIFVPKTAAIGQHVIPMLVSVLSKDVEAPSLFSQKYIIPPTDSNITRLIN